MPKIYIATPSSGDAKHLASGSFTTIKERLRAFPDTQWNIKTIQIKADVPTICSLIEDWTQISTESSEPVRVNSSGQVRSVK